MFWYKRLLVFGTQQRLHRQGIEGIDIALGGESVKHCDAFKYLGVILDSSLSLNQHIDYVKKKVSKMLRIFSRAQPSLTIEIFCWDVAFHRTFRGGIMDIFWNCTSGVTKHVFIYLWEVPWPSG